jgi:hypothetical protein
MTCSFVDVLDVYLASLAAVYILNPIFYLHVLMLVLMLDHLKIMFI